MPKYHDEALALTREAQQQFAFIAALRRPDLSPEGLAEAQTNARTALREALAQGTTQLRSRAEAVRHMAQLRAAAVRPRIGDDAGAILRSRQKWDQAVMLLEAGRSLREIIDGADLGTVLAIEEFAPTWLAAQTKKPMGLDGLTFEGGPVDVSGLITPRLIDLSPDDAAAALKEAQEVSSDVAQATPYIDYAQSLADGTARDSGHLEAAVASQYAAA